MESIDPLVFEFYPNLEMTSGMLMEGEQPRDLGNAQKAYAKAMTEITSSR